MFEAPLITNWQLAIGNWQSPGSLFIRFARSGSERAALIALAQLSARTAALQGAFIRAQSSASVDRQYALHLSMRPRNHMDADQFSHSARRCRACISRRFNRSNIATH